LSLEEQFKSAAERVKALTSRPTNEQLLDLYALYKQGTDGDCSGARPGMFDLKGRAKFDAWASKKGLGKDQARQNYVALVDKLVKG
jgi:diazepam-binding inhibitor (GABA receptor modulating acyl-CoA-binding protein)